MNSCVLMAQIVSDPELRMTQDNREISSMMVEFEGLRSEDPSGRIKVVGWGNLATEIKNSYHQGDRIILEGRLSMNVINMPEGYKEKHAELIASRIYRLDGAKGLTSSTTVSMSSAEIKPPSNIAAIPHVSEPISSSKTSPEPIKTVTESYSIPADTPIAPVTNPPATNNNDWDDIPF